MHVSRTLCSPGIKCLTAEDRKHLITDPTLPAADRDLLMQLRTAVASNSSRIETLEFDVSQITTRVDGLLSAKTNTKFDPTVPAPDLSIPLPVARLCNRVETVGTMERLLTAHPWLAVCGGPDAGKTQLVIQIAKTRKQLGVWIRFHHSQDLDDSLSPA